MHDLILHIFTPQVNSANKIEDLTGKKIGTYEKGTGAYVIASAMLDALDIKPGNILYQSVTDSGYSLIDGTVEALIAGHPVSAAHMVERTTRADLRWLPVDDSHFAKIQAKYPGLLSQYMVPGGVLKGVDQDTPTVSFLAVYVADERVPADAIYEITKTFWEHQEEATAIAALAGEATEDYVRYDYPVPYHDGALRYYKEKGWVK